MAPRRGLCWTVAAANHRAATDHNLYATATDQLDHRGQHHRGKRLDDRLDCRWLVWLDRA
jgi:hypothetical protein